MRRLVGLLRWLALLLVVLIGLTLHARNAQPVTLDLYFLTLQQPLSLLLALALLAGALLGMGAALPTLLSGKRANRRLRRELKLQTSLRPPPPVESSSKDVA